MRWKRRKIFVMCLSAMHKQKDAFEHRSRKTETMKKMKKIKKTKSRKSPLTVSSLCMM